MYEVPWARRSGPRSRLLLLHGLLFGGVALGGISLIQPWATTPSLHGYQTGAGRTFAVTLAGIVGAWLLGRRFPGQRWPLLLQAVLVIGAWPLVFPQGALCTKAGSALISGAVGAQLFAGSPLAAARPSGGRTGIRYKRAGRKPDVDVIDERPA